MTGAAWLDVIVVLVAFVAAASGWRSGAVASALSFVGVVLGAVAGIMLAPHIVSHFDNARTRLVVGVLIIVVLVVIGEVSGMVLGRTARDLLRNNQIRTADSIVGSLLQVVAVLTAAWLLAIPIGSSTQPELAAAVKGSRVLTRVDNLAPSWLRNVPSDLSALLDTSGLPDVLGPFGRTPIVSVDSPDPALAQDPIISSIETSVLKVHGVAPSCQKALEGSGFVVGAERIMTNAHVVAGTTSLAVETADGDLAAQVVLFDPQTDIAVLSVPGLTAPPLQFVANEAETGSSAIVLGYPGGGSYTASPARVREALNLTGPNIYRTTTVTREVYTIRGSVRQGNSGGPMINETGGVLGVVFGAAIDDPDTGFVLTAKEVASQLAQIGLTAQVDTGDCVGG